MSEKAPSFEHKNIETDRHEDGSETVPPQVEVSPDEHQEDSSETLPTQAEKEMNAEAKTKAAEAREKIKHEIDKPKLETLDESARSASIIIRVPLQSLEPVVETISKTWTSIRQNLSPSQKTFSKVIHNPVISSVSEFTAKTLARPYAILAGSVVAVIGSAVYLYLTKHYGYQYNYFVPILLFVGGLAAGIAVELFYKMLFAGHKK